jgi:hypothetical protein
MSKMSELSQVLSELKDCGKALINIADSLTEIFSSTDDVNEEIVEESIPEYSFLDVRKKFAEMARAGHTEALKELLKRYGADKLSSIDQSQYVALLADAEAIK